MTGFYSIGEGDTKVSGYRRFFEIFFAVSNEGPGESRVTRESIREFSEFREAVFNFRFEVFIAFVSSSELLFEGPE